MPRPKRRPTGEEGFGPRLRRLRIAKGLTQAELGARVGLSNRMVAYYEIQGGEPRPELVSKLSAALGVSITVLLAQEPSRAHASEAPDNVRLWRRFKRLQELPPHDRKAILKMIDALAGTKRKVS